MAYDSRNNHGKELSLEEKYSNVVGQLSEMTDRTDRAERDLELERVSRDATVSREVERRVAERIAAMEEDRINREVERRVQEQIAAKEAEMNERIAAKEAEMKDHIAAKAAEMDMRLRRQAEDMTKSFEQLQEKILADTRRQMMETMEAARIKGMEKFAEQADHFLNAYIKMTSGNLPEAHSLLEKYKSAISETETALNDTLEKKLDKVMSRGCGRTRQINEMVRMLFTQKSERMVFTGEQQETLLVSILNSVSLTEKEKEDFKSCNRKIREYRERRQTERILKGEDKKSHGRNKLPDNMPSLTPITIYPDEYYGHEDEYIDTGMKDIQKFIVPASTPYYKQEYIRPILVRKGDVTMTPIQSKCFEGPLWKSYASPQLLAKLEYSKYVLHMPFNRQIKDMRLNGLDMSASTTDGWHQAVCDMIRPLYDLVEEKVMRSACLAADGSPMPVVDSLKHRTKKQYLILYRSIDNGMVLFKSTPPIENVKGMSNGRGSKVIEMNLEKWTGQALLCDAYAGYDFLRKIGRILCRCAAHSRRLMERATKENPTLANPGMLLYQQAYAVEDMIKEMADKGETTSDEDIVAFRKEYSTPIWECLRSWCLLHLPDVPKDTYTYKAMNYLIRHYEELTNYIGIAKMPIDNNDTERGIREMVMGRKAYLFCRNHDACDHAAIMYTLLGNCKVLGKNPEKWLADVFKRIGATPPSLLHTLLPSEWEEKK